MKRRLILVPILCVGIFLFAPMVHCPDTLCRDVKDKKAAGTEPEINIKFAGIKHSRDKGKDSIQLYLSSNLPKGAMLQTRLKSVVFSPRQGMEQKTLRTWLMEVGEGGRAQGRIRRFPWALPPAIYVVEVGLSKRQRRNMVAHLPREQLDKVIARQEIVLRNGKTLIDTHRIQLQVLRSFCERASNDLSQFVDLYNTGQFNGQEREMLGRLEKISQAIDKELAKTTLFSTPDYPGLYRLSFQRASNIKVTLSHLISRISGYISGQAPLPGGAGNPPPGQQNELAIKPALDDITRQISNTRNDLLKEAIFDLMVILNHYARDMGFTDYKIRPLVERRRLWKKEHKFFQEELDRFDKYFKRFREDFSSDRFSGYYKNISAYQVLVRKLLATYSSLIVDGEKESFEQTLQKTIKSMKKLFPSPMNLSE